MKSCLLRIVLSLTILQTCSALWKFNLKKKLKKAEQKAKEVMESVTNPLVDVKKNEELKKKIYGALNDKRVPRLQPLQWKALNREISAGQADVATYIEGDIKNSESIIALKNGVNKRELVQKFKWPSSTIPYIFDPTMTKSKKEAVNDAITDFQTFTCIKFVPKTNEPDFLNFLKDKDMCYSNLGRVGGKQDISIGSGCGFKGTVIHELMHALGFSHEHTRPDRDQYIQVKLNNVKKAMRKNFDKHDANLVTDFNAEYDLLSIMHYGQRAFGKFKGLMKTIKAVDPNFDNDQLGQRSGFSEIDLQQIRKAYCENPTATTSTTMSTLTTTTIIPTTTAAPTQAIVSSTLSTPTISANEPTGITTSTTTTPTTTTTTTTVLNPLSTESTSSTVNLNDFIGAKSTETTTTLQTLETTKVTAEIILPSASTVSPIDIDDSKENAEIDDDDDDDDDNINKVLHDDPNPINPTVKPNDHTEGISLPPKSTPKQKAVQDDLTTTPTPLYPGSCPPQPTYPCWPNDFTWSSVGIPINCNCNSQSKSDRCKCNCVRIPGNDQSSYLCYKGREVSPQLRWSIRDNVSGEKCIPFNQSYKKGYLCAVNDAPYQFKWSKSEKHNGEKKCLKIGDDKKNKMLNGEFLCA